MIPDVEYEEMAEVFQGLLAGIVSPNKVIWWSHGTTINYENLKCSGQSKNFSKSR